MHCCLEMDRWTKNRLQEQNMIDLEGEDLGDKEWSKDQGSRNDVSSKLLER